MSTPASFAGSGPVDAPAGRLPRRHGGRRPLVAPLAAIALLCAACGVPYGSSPIPLSEPLPAQLTSPSQAIPSTTLPATGHGAVAEFYYVESSLLKPFPQSIPRPVTLPRILQTLESGPSIAVAGSGGVVTTDIPVGSDLTSLGIANRVARVGLDQAYYELGLQQEIIELGQIVYTLIGTDSLGIKAVQFFSNGLAVAAVNASGQTVYGPVNESGYCIESASGCPTAHKRKAKRTRH
ncbi:MAG: hypothetical protein ACYCST_04165 [Acidimicrobiales bacterium]